MTLEFFFPFVLHLAYAMCFMLAIGVTKEGPPLPLNIVLDPPSNPPRKSFDIFEEFKINHGP